MKIVSLCIFVLYSVSSVFSMPLECQENNEERYLKELEEIERIENQESLKAYVSNPASEQKVLWIDIKPSDEVNFTSPTYDKKVNDTIQITKEFYAENSGNKQIMHFTKAVYINEKMTRANCNSYSGFCESAITVGIRAYRALDPYNNYDIRVLNFYKSCNCMRFSGLAVVGGRDSYINNISPTVVAHEIGHNNGAHHASFGSSEYGSILSTMGAYMGPPPGHFTVGAKVTFRWLEKQHIAIVKGNNSTFWLQSHDNINNTFNNDTIYAIRIDTEFEGRYLWVEYRTKYDETRGLHLVLSKERTDPLNDNLFSHINRVYGYSQQIDYMSGTYTLSDSELKLGHYYSYRNKFLVHFKQQENDKVLIEIIYLNKRDINPPPMLSLKCGEMINVPAGTNMVKFHLDHPSPVKFSTLTCENYDPNRNNYLNIFNRYPIEHQYNPVENMDIGGVFKTYLNCNGVYYTTSALTYKYNKNGLIYNHFNQDNYIHLDKGPDTSVMLRISCDAPYYCDKNYYKQDDICIPCPNGTVSSYDSNHLDNCHKRCDRIASWTYDGRREGLHIKSNTTHWDGFPVYEKIKNGILETAIVKAYGRWSIIGAGEITRGWWSNRYAGISNSDHPAGLSFTESNGQVLFTCACDEPNHYVDINTRECIRCPPGHTIEPGHITSKNCIFNNNPTLFPTESPNIKPSKVPTSSPNIKPTLIPTYSPSHSPTKWPTDSPTYKPSESPSVAPTDSPTETPTGVPSMKPTPVFTNTPSESPTNQPTLFPTKNFEQFLPEKSAKHKTYYNSNYTRIWGGVKPKHRTAHGKFLSSQGINIWNFYVNRLQSGEHAFFGIQSNYKYKNKFPAHFSDGSIGYRGSGEKWFRGKKSRHYGIRPSGIGTLHRRVRELATGDTVTMVYNTNETSLEFFVNGVSYGVAYNNIPYNETFHMEVTIGYNNRADISILGYEHFR